MTECPLNALWVMCALPGCFFEVRRDGLTHWVACEDPKRFKRVLAGTGQRCVSFAPRLARDCPLAGGSGVLWCEVASGESLARLRRYRPRPSMVLRYGQTVRHMAVWWLARPLQYDQAARANKRLAHHLRAPKKQADPNGLFAVPSSTVGNRVVSTVYLRAADCPVSMTRPLRDPPDPNGWRRWGGGEPSPIPMVRAEVT